MRTSRIVAIGGTTLLIAIVLLLTYPVQPPSSPQQADEDHVIIDGMVIKVEIADEPNERRRGLMYRESLPRDHGMLFVFDREDIYSFWMMNVRFGLDIIWISSTGNVVHIERDVPPCFENCPSYTPTTPASYVLEVNSGLADDLDLKEDSYIEISLTNS